MKTKTILNHHWQRRDIQASIMLLWSTRSYVN